MDSRRTGHPCMQAQLPLWGDEDDALIDDGRVRPPTARRRRSRRLWTTAPDAPVVAHLHNYGRCVTVETGDYL